MNIKIATWNVNSFKVRLPHVLNWLKETQTDILCLQELKQTSDMFPEEELKALGYHCAWIGQKTYNGVAIISKYPLDAIVYNNPYYEDDQKRLIKADITIQDQTYRVICAYCPNGSEVGSDKYEYKLAWFDALHTYIESLKDNDKELILLGDFNIAPADIDHHEKFTGPILISDLERESFLSLLNIGLHDSFRETHPEERIYSWWDYRMYGFKRNAGLRIDHILITPHLLSKVDDVWVDIEPRKWERPSDHAPVVLSLAI